MLKLSFIEKQVIHFVLHASTGACYTNQNIKNINQEWHKFTCKFRVPCQRSGGIKFKLSGNAYWLLVYILNVGGPGDVCGMWVKGDNTDWISMSQNFGSVWQAFANLGGQGLSFKLTACSSEDTVISNNVADSNWGAGLIYQATNNFGYWM